MKKWHARIVHVFVLLRSARPNNVSGYLLNPFDRAQQCLSPGWPPVANTCSFVMRVAKGLLASCEQADGDQAINIFVTSQKMNARMQIAHKHRMQRSMPSASSLSLWGRIIRIHASRRCSCLSGPPCLTFRAHGGSVYALEFVSSERLVSAGEDAVCGWDWNDLLKRSSVEELKQQPSNGNCAASKLREVAAAFTLRNPRRVGKGGALAALDETNCLALLDGGRTLVCGSGDGNLYGYDLGSAKLTATLRGHSQCVHAATAVSQQQIASGSEDGATIGPRLFLLFF